MSQETPNDTLGDVDEEDVSIEADIEEGFIENSQPPVKEKESVSTGQVVFAVCFYVFISLSTVFTNKYIFTYMDHKFDFPLTVTCYQVLFSFFAMVILCILNQLFPYQKFMELPKLTFSFQKIKACLLPCLIFTLMISFNNFCLSYVDVTLYLVFRSLTVLFSVSMTYLILKQKSSILTIFSLFFVSGGYIIGSAGGFNNKSYTMSVIILGMICGTCSSFFVALNSIFAKRVIRDEFDNDFWDFLLYQNGVGFFMFLIISIISGEIFGVLQYEHFFNFGFIFVTLSSCMFGFLINVAYNLLIRSTTPLTKETVATAKACLQPILGKVLFHDDLNILTVVGAIVCIFGSFFYSLSKMYGK